MEYNYIGTSGGGWSGELSGPYISTLVLYDLGFELAITASVKPTLSVALPIGSIVVPFWDCLIGS